MNCPYCGEVLSDNAAFCGACGANLNSASQQNQSAQQNYYVPQQPQQPQQNYYAPQQSYYVPQQSVRPISKKEFIRTNETAGHKAKLVLLTMLISVALIVASIVGAMTMPFYEIPVVKLALEDEGLDVSEIEEGFEELEDDYYAQKDAMPEEEQEAAEMMLDSLDTLVDNFSIVNIYGFMDVMDEVVEILEDAETMEDVSDIADTMDEISQIMSIAVSVLVGFFVLPLLLTVLGGLFKSTGLTITAVIFTLIPQMIFCGVLWAAASLAVAIFQAVLCSGISREYKEYRMGRPVM